jgi:hypothetical protein
LQVASCWKAKSAGQYSGAGAGPGPTYEAPKWIANLHIEFLSFFT